MKRSPPLFYWISFGNMPLHSLKHESVAPAFSIHFNQNQHTRYSCAVVAIAALCLLRSLQLWILLRPHTLNMTEPTNSVPTPETHRLIGLWGRHRRLRAFAPQFDTNPNHFDRNEW